LNEENQSKDVGYSLWQLAKVDNDLPIHIFSVYVVFYLERNDILSYRKKDGIHLVKSLSLPMDILAC
jgi:hypothetical protein